MKITVYNQEGKEVEQIVLPKEIFQVPLVLNLVRQVTVSQMANKRQNTAHTKDRSVVRGGGKKPWKQKGTGRARHGSIRSPLWIGGGVTFGPTNEKNIEKKIPKKMRRKALFMVLSEKVKNNLLLVLDSLSASEPKTKLMANVFQKLPLKNGSTLLGLTTLDNNLILAARNLHNVKTIQVKDLNCLDLLNFKYLIITKDSIKVLKETFLK